MSCYFHRVFGQLPCDSDRWSAPISKGLRLMMAAAFLGAGLLIIPATAAADDPPSSDGGATSNNPSDA
jgi:hypothetical protein